VLVFVYGTLTDPDRAASVLGEPPDYAGDGTLVGCHRVDGDYPTLAPGGRVTGRLLRTDEDGLAALDAYEGVDRGLYVRVSVPLVDGADIAEAVETYVGDPAALDAPADWPGTGSFAERVARAVADGVRVERG
jgi:gamma-glutamylcyclotransferase (GGCT)/AIG2-like uncharacterized protein YtfP